MTIATKLDLLTSSQITRRVVVCVNARRDSIPFHPAVDAQFWKNFALSIKPRHQNYIQIYYTDALTGQPPLLSGYVIPNIDAVYKPGERLASIRIEPFNVPLLSGRDNNVEILHTAAKLLLFMQASDRTAASSPELEVIVGARLSLLTGEMHISI